MQPFRARGRALAVIVLISSPALGRAQNINLLGTWYREGDRARPTVVWQSGGAVVFVNEFGSASQGHFEPSSVVVADDWERGLRGTISADGNRIDWANSSSWRRLPGVLDLSGTWYSGGDRGRPTSISQSGETLMLVNEHGNRSGGHVAGSTVVAHDWEGCLRGTVSPDGSRIDWANGTFWVRLRL